MRMKRLTERPGHYPPNDTDMGDEEGRRWRVRRVLADEGEDGEDRPYLAIDVTVTALDEAGRVLRDAQGAPIIVGPNRVTVPDEALDRIDAEAMLEQAAEREVIHHLGQQLGAAMRAARPLQNGPDNPEERRASLKAWARGETIHRQ